VVPDKGPESEAAPRARAFPQRHGQERSHTTAIGLAAEREARLRIRQGAIVRSSIGVTVSLTCSRSLPVGSG
jgi:hypothetical protein